MPVNCNVQAEVSTDYRALRPTMPPHTGRGQTERQLTSHHSISESVRTNKVYLLKTGCSLPITKKVERVKFILKKQLN